MASFTKGDHVTWNTSQGETHGKVVEERTKDFQHDGQHFRASEDEPAYIVESDKSGKTAAHKGSALTKRK
ncbi:hypervirulence associated TUDOR domain-containing protein [Clavibacter sp. km1a]|uniref:hypervirulence associated TUDOR domain-containing protein n=1 Tax=Clavibacter sp. km1a TaxID=3459136 RepID=UPI0040410107